MVYDITSEDSFRHINDWLQEVNRYAAETTSKLLIGNKADLVSQRKVSTETGKEKAEQLQIPFMETSALDSTNVQAAFEHITRSLLSKNSPTAAVKSPAAASSESNTRITAQNVSDGGPKKGGCC